MRALVIGAGAIGQVYGRHLAQGGAQVTFLVKPEHEANTRSGLTLYRLNRSRRRRTEPERLTGYGVCTRVSDTASAQWDQVYLATSSTALRAGPWFGDLSSAIGDATVVLLQPGPEDREFVVAHVPEHRIVQGIITVISYRAPLPGETRFPEPGIAYWFPPLTPSPLSGAAARVVAVVHALRRGGLPARRIADVASRGAFGAALLMPVIAVLESVGWRLDALRHRAHLALAIRAGREAMDIVAQRRGRHPPLALRLAGHALVVRSLLRVAPLATPFDLETYLRVHFTKVGDQTRDALRTYLAWGRTARLPTEALAKVSG